MMPVASSVASSQNRRDPLSPGQFGQIRETKDSPPARSYRVSARELADIAGRLSDLDGEVLELVARTRLCSGRQLQRAFWFTGTLVTRERRARQALKRLTDRRVLDRLPRVVGGVRSGSAGFVYGVGAVGARLLAEGGGRGRRLGTPGARYVDHTLAAAELVVELMEAERAGRLEVLEIATEPTCWRPFAGALGARLTLKPDLFVRIGVGSFEDRWFVEVDRATEAAPTITAKGRRYLDHFRSGSEQGAHGVYPRVLWSVPDAARAQVVADALAQLPGTAVGLFAVCCHDAVIARLAEEAGS
jgi:hypothetical protein